MFHIFSDIMKCRFVSCQPVIVDVFCAEGFEVNTRLLRLIDPDVVDAVGVGAVVHKILRDSHQ